jgi:AcrR family transcriptional regulator
MSQIAAETGIGRATLYKYFPDVEAILVAWHERQVAEHQLRDFAQDLLRDGAASGEARDDVATDALAGYCLHGVAAARSLPSKAAVHRLVTVIRDG